MRKLLSLVLIALVSVSVMFAESYDELLAKAKSYEAKKEWVYAMGYYYDAAFAENAQEEAQQKFDALSAEIANGNPGFGKFNVFSLYDEWVNLVKNFVKYFTEFSPYSVWYDRELVLKETDYKAKKATYDMKCSLVPTQKFRYIEYALQEGYKKCKKDDWTGFWVLQRSSFSAETPFPKFPSKFSTIQDKYDKLLISIIDSRKSNAGDATVESLKTELKNEIKRIYNEEGMAVVAWPSISTQKLSAMRSYYGENKGLLEIKEVYANFGKYSSGDVSAGYETNFYDVQFGLYDKDGKLLVKGTRQNTYSVLEAGTDYKNKLQISMERNLENFKNSRGTYSFPGITQDIMEVIVSGEVIVKPIGVFLNYGVILFGDYDSDNPRAVLKPLFDTTIDKDSGKVRFVTLEEAKQFIASQKLAAEKAQADAEKKIEELVSVQKKKIFDIVDKYIEEQKVLTGKLGFSLSSGLSGIRGHEEGINCGFGNRLYVKLPVVERRQYIIFSEVEKKSLAYNAKMKKGYGFVVYGGAFLSPVQFKHLILYCFLQPKEGDISSIKNDDYDIYAELKNKEYMRIDWKKFAELNITQEEIYDCINAVVSSYECFLAEAGKSNYEIFFLSLKKGGVLSLIDYDDYNQKVRPYGEITVPSE